MIERQMLDCNCNDCLFMKRDLESLQIHKKSYEGTGLSDKLNFGYCEKFNKDVVFSPNTIQLDTQDCFKHRKDIKL